MVINGSAGDDVGLTKLVGTDGGDIINGLAGNDSLEGGGGDDVLYGDYDSIDLGGDTLEGGAGNDILHGVNGDDFLNGGEGNDKLFGELGGDSYSGGNGDDSYYLDAADFGSAGRFVYEGFDGGVDCIFTGGVGIDTVIGYKSIDLTWTMLDYSLLFENIENVQAQKGGDNNASFLIVGNDFDNVITGAGESDGLGGRDFIVGGSGNDSLYGLGGDDTYVLDCVGDVVFESSNVGQIGYGNDLIVVSLNYTLNASNVERVAILSGAGDLNVMGDSYSNIVSGNDGNNLIDGGGGADTLNGGIGNDTFIVNSSDDVVADLATVYCLQFQPVWQTAEGGHDEVRSSVNFTLSSDIEDLLLQGSAVIGAGSDSDNTIAGNATNNLIYGNAGNDTLSGGDGFDTIYGGDGGDLLSGGADKDDLYGGAGDDTYVFDGADNFIELSGEGSDTVRASVDYTLAENIETLVMEGAAISGSGNTLNNTLWGNAHANTLSGYAGDDYLDGGAGADTLQGGTGNDTYILADTTDVVLELASEGSDEVRAGFDYTLSSNLENLVLLSGSAVTAVGNSGVNVITGNGNDNMLDGKAGADTMTGGMGNDTYVLSSGDVVMESAGEGVDKVMVGFSYTLGSNFENLQLSGTASASATGNQLDNWLWGNSANNSLTGLEGNDLLDGDGGNDTLRGGLGNDTYVLDSSLDVVVELAGEGLDEVRSGQNYTLGSYLENLTLIGSAINGSGNADGNVLTGNAANNSLSGLDGNDVLDGGAGIDTLTGGLGDDSYILDSASDVIVEDAGAGTDTIRISANYTLGANLENLILEAAASSATGNSLNNVIMGNAANNLLDGKAGADTMTGGQGNDTYVISSGDVVNESTNEGVDQVNVGFSYTLGSNIENLLLTGTAGASGTGNDLNNQLAGNSGNNRLDGMSGMDTLSGGAGNDTYVASLGMGADTVIENDGTSGNQDVLSFLTGVATDQVWFRHVANDLEVTIIGTADQMLLKDWYGGSAYKVESIKTTDGAKTLSATNVENLVAAMATLTPPPMGQTSLDTSQHAALDAVIAANWS